ncbi:iron dicitrate transport regulator FecR [Ectothiorhodospira shaposhnikovii]|nr:iron dicitrate transport regulator FecR [Ectothiorhodospira shaposhnikovii]
MEQAAEWFALLRSGEASDADRAQWQAWLASARENVDAWHYVERISRRFEPLQGNPARRAAVSAFQRANEPCLKRRETLLGIVTLLGVGVLGWGCWSHTPLPGIAMARRADHRTATGEQREIFLSDGTRVWLNTATAISEDFSIGQRRLRLVAGEILIQTASDPLRPFLVDTPQGSLYPIGTRFTVRLDRGETFVAVYEGAVEVITAGGEGATLSAGKQTHFTERALAFVEVADPARQVWSQGILLADNIPLADMVRELRRYRPGHLGLSPEVADLRVFGSYPINDPDRALAMLESVMPIRVHRRMSWWVSIEPER